MVSSQRVLLYLFFFAAIFLPTSLYAAEGSSQTKRELRALKKQLQQLENRVAFANKMVLADSGEKQNPSSVTLEPKKHTKKTKAALKKNTTTTSTSDNSGATDIAQNPASSSYQYNAWSLQGPDISGLIVGGASAGYSKPSSQGGSFNILDFNPIFLFGYKDIFFMRSAVDFSIDNQGNTATALNYANLNAILNDYVVLAAGEFDSALGYFQQNLSPAWINRLPDAPPGYSSNQAAPQAEVGLQLRGAFSLLSQSKVNYVIFVSNGQQGFVDTTNLIVNYIGTNGYTNNNGNYEFGGRLGFLPIPKLEIGISAATGKVALFDSSSTTTLLQKGRGYNVLGADFSYKWNAFDLRAEYIQQQIVSQSQSIVPQGEKWKAYYFQVAYWIPATKFEPVIRYGNFKSPQISSSQHQWAFGIDYWIASSIAARASYEINGAQIGSGNNVNQFLAQLVFGF